MEEFFYNEYWNNYEEGIYVDVVFGEFLFSLFDKYDFGIGWLSFIKFLEEWVVVEVGECEGFFCGWEVWSCFVGFYFGYVFDEFILMGKCYCINFVVFCFILRDEFRRYGYIVYEGIFK